MRVPPAVATLAWTILLAPFVAGAASAPAVEEIVPGELVVRVYSHSLDTHRGALPVWTFVSDGLRAARQKELFFTVRRFPEEKDRDYPRDLLVFYRVVHALARAGRLVDVGDITRIRPDRPGFLGRDDFRCIIYGPYQPLGGIPAPGPSLTGLIVTCNESDALAFGLTRVMARLGQAERFYPTAPWADRERAEVIGAGGNATSFLERLPRVRLRDGWARREPDGKVVLTFGEGAREQVRRILAELPARKAFGLLVTVDPEADACLVWQPGQEESTAIAAPGSRGERVAANFVAFAIGLEPETITLIEDGFVVAITEATWERVRSALAKNAPLSLPELEDGFEIVWVRPEEGIHRAPPPSSPATDAP